MSLVAIRRWRDLERWVSGRTAIWTTSFPQIPLGEVLVPRHERVTRVDFADCLPITIHFDGSVDIRDRAVPFAGPMFAAYPGDVVFSKIDVRNGALAMLPDTIKKAVVTSEYPVHQPDLTQIDPRFFALILRSPNFLQLLKDAASGTSGRKRVNAEAFEAIEIPLPTPEEQRAFVDAYEASIASARALEQEALDTERIGLAGFEAALGLIPPPDLPRRPFQITRFRDIERWSHEGILYRSVASAAGIATERFPMVALGEVIADLENGWSPQCIEKPAQLHEWGVLKLGAVSFGEYNDKENKTLPPHLTPLPALEIRPGDVLISRANVPRLVGACAYVGTTRQRLMLCDKIFRVVWAQQSMILPEFLAEIMKLGSVRQQIECEATGTSPTMQNISKPALLELSFPLPQGEDGLEKQKLLVEVLTKSRANAARRRVSAKKIRQAAWSDFLATIFA